MVTRNHQYNLTFINVHKPWRMSRFWNHFFFYTTQYCSGSIAQAGQICNRAMKVSDLCHPTRSKRYNDVDFLHLILWFWNISPFFENRKEKKTFRENHFITNSKIYEIGPVVLEKMIFQICHRFSQFGNILPLEKGGALHLYKFEFLSPKNDLCKVWLKLPQWLWRRF